MSETQCWWDWCLVVDLCSLILLYTEHITVGEISIYFCIKQHQISRNRSVKNVTVFTWEVNSLDSLMGRVGNKGMYAAFWCSPPSRRILRWGIWAFVCGSHLSWILSSYKSSILILLCRAAVQGEVGRCLLNTGKKSISLLRQMFGMLIRMLPWQIGQDSSLRLNSLLHCWCFLSAHRQCPFSFCSLPSVSFHTQHSLEKAKPYTDTKTVYLGRGSIIYAVQLFAWSLLCLLFPWVLLLNHLTFLSWY